MSLPWFLPVDVTLHHLALMALPPSRTDRQWVDVAQIQSQPRMSHDPNSGFAEHVQKGTMRYQAVPRDFMNNSGRELRSRLHCRRSLSAGDNQLASTLHVMVLAT